MDTLFKASTEFIIRRNVSERVEQVLASFASEAGILHVVYLTKNDPLDSDIEDCEIAGAELVAEFPEVKKLNLDCLSHDKRDEYPSYDVVYDKHVPVLKQR